MNPIITHYSPGPFKYNPELFLNSESTEEIRLGIGSQLKCTPGEDQFGVQFHIVIRQGDQDFLKVGMLFAFQSEGFGKMLENDPTLKDHRPELEDICKQAWNAAVGSVAALTVIRPEDCPAIDKDAQIRSGFVLPPLSYEKMASDIEIVLRPEATESI